MTTVSLPTARNIEQYAFSHCSSLQSATLPNVIDIGNYAFSRCTNLATLALGATVPTGVGGEAFFECNAPNRKLKLVKADGTPLTDRTNPTLSDVETAYDKVALPDTDNDNLWHGWVVREVCACTISVPTFPDGEIKIPANDTSTTYTLSANGPVLGGNFTMSGHSGAPVIYSFAEKQTQKTLQRLAVQL